MAVKNLIFNPNASPPADSQYLNSVRAEINNLVVNTNQTLSDSNLNQLGIAVATMAAGADFYTDSGIANAYVLSGIGLKSTPIAYFVGMRVRFFPGHNNTGASTINVQGIGSVNIKARDGTSTPASADITAGRECQLTHNGTNFVIAL